MESSMPTSRITESRSATVPGHLEPEQLEALCLSLERQTEVLQAELRQVKAAGSELARVMRQVRSWVEWSAEPPKRRRFRRRRKADMLNYRIGRDARESVLQRYEELLARWESATDGPFVRESPGAELARAARRTSRLQT
jgi:hypothetical protein